MKNRKGNVMFRGKPGSGMSLTTQKITLLANSYVRQNPLRQEDVHHEI